MLGAQAVAKAFPEYPTTIVRVTPPAVHLKDYISMAGPEVMAVGRSEAAQQTFLVLILINLLVDVVSVCHLLSVTCILWLNGASNCGNNCSQILHCELLASNMLGAQLEVCVCKLWK